MSFITLLKRYLLGLFFLFTLTPAAAVDCQSVRQNYQCPADERYPVHLTFDDGPSLQTQAVLDTLAHERIPATFFVLAEKIDCPHLQRQCHTQKAEAAATLDAQNETPQIDCQRIERQCQLRKKILARTKREGHLIGSHSYSHLRYSTLPAEITAHHFALSRHMLAPYLNTNPPLFRLPYGDGWFNRKDRPDLLQTVADKGFMHIAWDLSAFDWNPKNQQGDKILDNILGEVCKRRRGGIVLFHDGVDNQLHTGRSFTTENLGRWIPAMRCIVDFKPLSRFIRNFETTP